jgi:hypothetical protein
VIGLILSDLYTSWWQLCRPTNFTETMKSFKILIFIFFAHTLFGCMDKIDNRYLMVKNNSEKTIYSIISPDNQMVTSGYYAEFQGDENKYIKTNQIDKFIFEPIKPTESATNHDRPMYWDISFEQIEDKKIRLFIVPQDSVDKYGWFKIFKKNVYAKKYTLSLKDLESQNWEIVYQ